MPGRAGGVAPGGRTATHTERTLYLRRTCSGRRMTQMGHEDAFPRPTLSARSRFSQRTFTGISTEALERLDAAWAERQGIARELFEHLNLRNSQEDRTADAVMCL